MAVSGKTHNDIPCIPCEDDERFTHAEGFCRECCEHMCRSCFNNHCRRRACRNHVLLGMNEERHTSGSEEYEEKLEKCQHHDEQCKFYCLVHKAIGCAECVFLSHKTCTVEYIRAMASKYKESQEFKDMVKLEDDCLKEAQQLVFSVNNNKTQVMDIYTQFVSDVHCFRDEIIARVSKLADEMITNADKVKLKDRNNMENIKKKNKDLEQQMSQLQQKTQSQIDEPIKLFTSSIVDIPEIKRIHKQMKTLEMRNTIDMYCFQRDSTLEHSVNAIGIMHTTGSAVIQPDLTQVVQQAATNVPQNIPQTIKGSQKVPQKVPQTVSQKVPQKVQQRKPQPLLKRQKWSTNVTVDGEYIQYNGANGDIGIFVDGYRWWSTPGKSYYYEIEITNRGEQGTIVLGVVDIDEHPKNKLPGYCDYSIGLNTSDGRLYINGKSTNIGVTCSVGDRIGCHATWTGVRYRYMFTKNGKQIAEHESLFCGYFAVGIQSSGQVKVILDAKSPLM